MISEDYVYFTQSCIVRGLSKKQFKVLCDVASRASSLRNCAIDFTNLIDTGDGKYYKKINYKQIITCVKEEFRDDYSLVQANIANNTIKKHVDSFNGYVELLNKKIDQQYDRPVHKPKKRDPGYLHNIIIPQKAITSSKKKLSSGYIELPLSREYKKKYLESLECRPRIKIPENIRGQDIIQVEIIPIKRGRMFKANFTYKAELDPWGLDKVHVMGIDLGVNNFVTVVTTEGTPFIVDGRFLKNQIAFKCKKTAHYQSILDKQKIKYSQRLINLNNKFKNIQDNYLNHTVKHILNTCKEQDVGTIILGYNQDFQYNSNIGAKQNQIFTHIAFKKFKQKLECKCKLHDINFVIQEESYTSKSSFLDDDILPTYHEKK